MLRYTTVVVARDCTRQLLAALLALRARAQPDEVLLIDNGSATDLGPIAKLSQLPIRVLRMPEHHSLGAALNAGIDAAAHDAILLLHGDTLLGSDPRLALTALDEQGDLGIVGGKLFRAGDDPRPLLQIGYQVSRGRINPQPIAELTWDVYHEPLAVAAVSAACMLLRRTEVRFDERYWFRLEDVDFCHQYAQRGWKVMMLPCLQAIHLENGGVRERMAESDWAARHLASYLLYHERWCSDVELEDHPRQPAVRGAPAIEYLQSRANVLAGRSLASLVTR
jgi:GT2 family glycosyltransferase